MAVTELDFAQPEWIECDFAAHDFLIFYPSFEFDSAHPLSLTTVRDHFAHIARVAPNLQLYPDLAGLHFYGDKYRQYLHLTAAGFPTPDTLPLGSREAVEQAADTFGFPLVVKNRFGAGGDYVLLVQSKQELQELYQKSIMDYSSLRTCARAMATKIFRREFYYWWLKRRELKYPFYSYPLLAQRFQPHERDLKIVVGDGVAIEAHWRGKASADMWKVNIDGGGKGIWSHVPEALTAVAINLAASIGAKWLNVDLFEAQGQPLISEFSPVWHHYRYGEKDSFVYQEDYNLENLDTALDLEEIIVRSFL